jgi:hypothetical protein
MFETNMSIPTYIVQIEWPLFTLDMIPSDSQAQDSRFVGVAFLACIDANPLLCYPAAQEAIKIGLEFFTQHLEPGAIACARLVPSLPLTHNPARAV